MPGGSHAPRPGPGTLPRPRKRLGQNFLRDRSFLARILAAGEVQPSDQILEVGPGTGVLTEALADAAARLVAVELDDTLSAHLAARYADNPRVEILHGNALDLDPCDRFEGPYKVIANIPYYITGPLLRRFLEARCRPILLVLMVQREVAHRITAKPGELSLLGVSVQRYAAARAVCRVPAGAFYPRPKVDSAIVRLDPYRDAPSRASDADFFTVARAGFGLRRKQLANALAHGLGLTRDGAVGLLQSAEIDPARRAETLSLEEWDRLACAWAQSRGRT